MGEWPGWMWLFNRMYFIMVQHLCHSRCTQRSFSITANAPNGAMGEKSIHQLFTEIVVYQKTAVQF